MEIAQLILLAVFVAETEGIQDTVFTRLGQAEASWDVDAVSESGCQGLYQINPRAWPVDEWVVETNDPFEPLANMRQAAHILKDMYSKFRYRDRAVAAYTLGEGAMGALLKEHGELWMNALEEPVRDYVLFVANGDPSTRFGAWDWRQAVREELGMGGGAGLRRVALY